MAKQWNFDLLEHAGASEALFVDGHRATRAERSKSNRAWAQVKSPAYKSMGCRPTHHGVEIRPDCSADESRSRAACSGF